MTLSTTKRNCTAARCGNDDAEQNLTRKCRRGRDRRAWGKITPVEREPKCAAVHNVMGKANFCGRRICCSHLYKWLKDKMPFPKRAQSLKIQIYPKTVRMREDSRLYGLIATVALRRSLKNYSCL